MFTFSLAFLQAIDSFLFNFNFFPQKEEEGIWEKAYHIHNENHWPQLPHVSGVECQIDYFACFAPYFSSFPKENAFQNLEENLWTINWKTGFPDFSLTLTISKIFPDFSLTLKNFRFSLTFPWPWKPRLLKTTNLQLWKNLQFIWAWVPKQQYFLATIFCPFYNFSLQHITAFKSYTKIK